jgi:hypothetical protein
VRGAAENLVLRLDTYEITTLSDTCYFSIVVYLLLFVN